MKTPKPLSMCARVAGLLLSVTLLTANVVSAENTPDYDAFDDMLLKNVRNGFIDYDGMSADPRFEVFVTQIGAGDDAALRTDADRLAFYVNAYNALAIKGILTEERRWQQTVKALQAQGATMPDHEEIDDVISRTWNCTSYDNRLCMFAGICNRDIGWEDPEAGAKFEPRTPHHALERAAFEALGATFPRAVGDE